MKNDDKRPLDALDRIAADAREPEDDDELGPEEVKRILAEHGLDEEKARAMMKDIVDGHLGRNVVRPLDLSRRRRKAPWIPLLAAAAVAALAVGYAWKTTRPRPEDDMANNPHHPVAPPDTAPSSPAPGLDIRGNPTTDPNDDLVAHPPPRPCKPLRVGYAKIEGTISKRGDGFVLATDDPICGADKQPLDAVDLEPANPKVDLARFGVERIAVEGRVAARDGGGLVVRVDRVPPR